MIEHKLAELTGFLQQHLLDAQGLPEHQFKHMLIAECSSLLHWYLGSEGTALADAWFVRDLDLHQEGEIPWRRLGLQARTALLCILREALQNSSKHRPGCQVLVQFRESTRELTMGIRQQGGTHPPPTASAGHSFGLQSMKFRASLAGGEVEWDLEQGLCLRLPLLT